MQEERVTFAAGSLRLEGMIGLPAGAARAAVVCHPHPLYGGTMDVPIVVTVVSELRKVGVATLRFNFRGAGRSEGEHEDGVGEVEDVRSAVAFLAERTGAEAIAVAGYSFGAVVALAAGADDSRVERIAAIAPPVTMFDVSFLSGCRKPKLFLIGDRDQYCSSDALERTVAGVAEPKELVHLAGADHFFGGFEPEVARHVVRFVAGVEGH